MLFAELVFKDYTFWDAIESGLYFVVVGYYFLLFAYFLLMRFRVSKKFYWLCFTLLFIFLAIGRVFFILYYFFIPQLHLGDATMARSLMIYYRLATFFTWCGIASLMGILGILLFPPEAQIDEKEKEKVKEGEKTKRFDFNEKQKLILRAVLIIIPCVVAALALLLPDSYLMDPDFVDEYNLNTKLVTINLFGYSYPVGRFIFNLVLVPILTFIIPLIFFYLAIKTFGVLRKSYALNAIGFLLYFAGRIADGVLNAMNFPHFKAILPPMLIILSLLIIVIANNYEQLK